MAIGITGKFKPDGNFPLMDAEDIEMPDGTRLSEYNPGSGFPGVTETDNGKIPQVVNGEIVLVFVKDSDIATYIDEYISSALDGDY